MLALKFTDKGLLEQAAASFQHKECSFILSEGCSEHTGFFVGNEIFHSNGTVEIPCPIAGSFKSRATDIEAVISASCAVSDLGVLAYTATGPDAIWYRYGLYLGKHQIEAVLGQTL